MKLMTLMLLVFITLSGDAQAKKPQDGPLIPIIRIAPQYPFKAYLGSIPGWVKVKMTINARGSVDDVEIVDSKPKFIFDKEAIRAAMKFKFKPRVVNGEAVEAQATQTFQFDHGLPEGISYEIKENLVQLMIEQINSIESRGSTVVLADSIKIQSKIKPKDVTSVDFYYSDDLMILNEQPHFWEYNQKNASEISDFAEQVEKRTALVKTQYRKHPGIYNKFHRVYVAKNHPPELISKVDYQPNINVSAVTHERFKLTIDETGKVVDWKELNNKKMSEYPHYQERVKQKLSELTFTPAIKNGKAVEDKITIEYSTVNISSIQAIDENLVQNQNHAIENPWVKLGALRNEKGQVVEVQVLSSSDKTLEADVVKEYQNKKNKKSRFNTQVIDLIIPELGG